jgi:hypothetical protein
MAHALKDPKVDFKQLEEEKIKDAIRTDFILSAEISVISLGVVADEPFMTRLGVLVTIAAIVTIGVYGLFAGIIKLDDAGLALTKKASGAAQATVRVILAAAPWLMRFLSIAGTAAMFLVGGGIISHAIPFLHQINESLVDGMAQPWLTLTARGRCGILGPRFEGDLCHAQRPILRCSRRLRGAQPPLLAGRVGRESVRRQVVRTDRGPGDAARVQCRDHVHRRRNDARHACDPGPGTDRYRP